MSEYYPTKHLMEKLEERKITWGEVIDVVENPEVTFGPDHRGRKTLQKGDLCVVVGSDNAVVTVLLRNAEQWTAQDAQARREPVPAIPMGAIYIQQGPARSGKTATAEKWRRAAPACRKVVEGNRKEAQRLADDGYAVVLNLLPGM